MWKPSLPNDQSPAIVGLAAQSSRSACSIQNPPGLLTDRSYSRLYPASSIRACDAQCAGTG